MNIQLTSPQVCTALLFTVLLTLSPVAYAQTSRAQADEHIAIRRTIPDPQAVRRSPITSDRLSTTSTRLIDARRGFRPHSSVFRDGGLSPRVARYDDHFGISRPQNRPWSYSQRARRSSVSQFRNDTKFKTHSSTRTAKQGPTYSRILIGQNATIESNPALNIRVHQDRNAAPKTSGAVLVTADGTVIQIGD